jgi:hypothetical protein
MTLILNGTDGLSDVDGTAATPAIRGTDTNTGIFFPAADTIAFAEGGTEVARFDSAGNLLVGTTSQVGAGKVGIAFDANTFQGLALRETAFGSGSTFISFRNSSNTAVGSITQSGTSNVAYNTSSDYRLKENIETMTGALAVVSALKPVTYKWKTDGSNGQGFIAHELQAIVPECVTGEKDAVNEDGSIKAQGIDTSFLVATLTAAIQELKVELDSVKAELATLKA